MDTAPFRVNDAVVARPWYGFNTATVDTFYGRSSTN